jgi:FlaG/FlaF family flagellin (archaellin)
MKYKHILLPIAGIVMIAAIIVSCSKQEQMEQISSSPEIYQSTTDVQIENKIKLFKGKLEYLHENPTFKSGETVTVDSAVWYFTAALNYTYARADYDFASIISDSAKITISTNGEELLLEALPPLYQQFVDSLSAKYHAIQSENKNLIMVNLVADEPTENGTELTLYSAMGEGTPTYIYGLFGLSDYWTWGFGLGQCDANINYGRDATTELQYKINHPIVTYPPGTYFIPDQNNTGWIYPWYNDGAYEDPNSPNGIYRLFFHETWETLLYEPCIPPDDMNYYLYDGVAYIMEDYKPAGKYLTLGEVDWTISQIGDYELRVHIVRFTYGDKYVSEDPTEDL